MRLAGAITALGLLPVVGCAGPAPSALTPCGEPRPQVCTQEYNPVCGELTAGGRRDYASPCNACAHDAVQAFEAGACAD